MTDLHDTSSIFARFPHPFITITTRPVLLTIHQHVNKAPFTILSPPHAGTSLGLPWWLHLISGIPRPSILDCGANAALAMEALYRGVDGVICREFHSVLPPAMRGRLFTIRPPETNYWQNKR